MFQLTEVGGCKGWREDKWTEQSRARIYLLTDNLIFPSTEGPRV